MSLGDAAAFPLVAVLTGAALWRGRFPFWVRVVLVLLGLLGMVLTLLSGMGLL
jgi:VIT1/CCC1 family predicted Fe2+/Mn2+ transporter